MLGKVGFMRNALVHVEKSRLVLVQSDTCPVGFSFSLLPLPTKNAYNLE